MRKVELLAPAGDLARLKIAVDYGADAVFIGGKQFSLRAKASNFTIADITEGAAYCHAHGAHLHVTVNIIPHDSDFEGLEVYLRALETAGVDAIIVASMSIVELAKRVAPKLEVHVSTQYSTTNSSAVEFWERKNVDRVVLGRECTLPEVQQMVSKTDLPIEAFIHGAMCTNFSGRCTLSNYMTLRDANRGGCAQSCRWKYDVYQNDQVISDTSIPFSMSSKDMNAMYELKALVDAGVASLKIEGRMKTEYYIACVVGGYRALLDAIENGHYNEELLAKEMNHLAKSENREAFIGYYHGVPKEEGYLYGVNGAGVNQDFLGVIKSCEDGYLTVEVRNHFSLGERVEVLDPSHQLKNFEVVDLVNSDGEACSRVYKPMEHVKIKSPYHFEIGSFLRRIV